MLQIFNTGQFLTNRRIKIMFLTDTYSGTCLTVSKNFFWKCINHEKLPLYFFVLEFSDRTLHNLMQRGDFYFFSDIKIDHNFLLLFENKKAYLTNLLNFSLHLFRVRSCSTTLATSGVTLFLTPKQTKQKLRQWLFGQGKN